MKRAVIVLGILIVVLLNGTIAYARVSNNPIFPTREEVQGWISDTANYLEEKIANLAGRVDTLEEHTAQGNLIFADSFSGTSIDTSKWVPTSGWSENLVLTVDGGEIGYTKKSDFSDFTLDIDFQINGRGNYNTANLALRMVPDNPYVGSYYLIQVTSKTSQWSPNSLRINRGPHILDKVIAIPMEIKNGDWHHLKITASEHTFSFFVNGRFIGRYLDETKTNHVGEPMQREGAIGIYAHGTPGSIFSDLVNYANLEITK